MDILFSVQYNTRWGENLFLVLPCGRFQMQYNEGGIWRAHLRGIAPENLAKYHYEVEFNGRFERREWGYHSRPLPSSRKAAGSCPDQMEINDMWRAPERSAGVAVPVFALRSEKSFGVGEFNDIRLLADWAAATGQKIIQLLPINDTTMTGTWVDSYPYSANSIYALHPQFVNLPDAGVTQDEEYLRLQTELNSLPSEDYERVNSEKDRLLRKAFAETGRSVCATRGYKDFIKANNDWLMPYAAFRILTSRFGTADFREWGDYAEYSTRKTESLLKKEKKEYGYHCFVQYHLHRQLSEAVHYAHSLGIYIKGDLPIGISPTSTDAWASPELFHLDSQAGAPPDAFAAKGQNWGLPTYNWDRMSKDGYAWWKQRMKKMEEYFDLFRIDHILGFFRIWEIPCGASSGLMGHFSPALPYSREYLEGLGFTLPKRRGTVPSSEDVLFVPDPYKKNHWHPRIAAQDTESYSMLDNSMKETYNRLYNDFFYHRHNEFWKESAMRKLPELLSSTGMLACGEDLGMIPDCVPEVMKDLYILSLEIQRMPKASWETFADVHRYPAMSVCATSTHDMNPLRAWWEEDRKLTGRFYNEVLGEEGPAPEKCEPNICRKIIMMHLESASALAILPLQDWLSMSEALRSPSPDTERINDPAEAPHYWRYRMHITLEDLLAATGFNAELRGMVSGSGR